MARGEWGMSGRCSYKKATLIVCCINLLLAFYVLRSLYASLYIYPLGDAHTTFKYTSDQIRKMEESGRIRKAAEPTELIELVMQLKAREERVELPKHLRQRLIDEIRSRLRSSDAAANATDQNEAVVAWHREKLEEARRIERGETLSSTILPEEAGILVRALSSGWVEFVEEIDLWIPFSVTNREHDDKPDGEDEFDKEMLPGRQLPPECHGELHTDYGGAAVRWGLTHHKESAYECCMACLDQAKRAKPGQKKCNIWVYCPSETGCYSPDIYKHKYQECWLKYVSLLMKSYFFLFKFTIVAWSLQSETPQLNFKDRYSEAYRDAHPRAPVVVPWVSGVVSA
ncbi:uncharacterized protein LOC131010861 isoform X2 [Salvia miltiorrhiza]|uniref:uncharacterized protein LOC131010861 isoform X2 n=1 Tax=Salvia miltiorrhiza TaxID=226208 RepID=UPI0025ABE0FC|nr:uncharacterized protein LOC131010861 isoform X2 [Salvia miltiorrhiza]